MHELRVLSRGSCDPSIVGQLQSVGQSSIAERHGGSERNGSGHVGNTVVEHAIHNEGRVIVSGRTAGLRACNSACVSPEWRHRQDPVQEGACIVSGLGGNHLDASPLVYCHVHHHGPWLHSL